MVLIEIKHRFPISVTKAFAYITDLNNWSAYWPDFVRMEDPANAKWGKPGDAVTIVLKLLDREQALNMTLEEFQKDVFVTYVSHQQGLPDARHERHFTATPEGFEYRLVVAFEPRPGWSGLFDRILLRWAVRRALRRTVENLSQVFHQPGMQN
jgi:hypothetical protein